MYLFSHALSLDFFTWNSFYCLDYVLFCLCLLRPRRLSDPSVFLTEFNQRCCCFRCSVSAFEAVSRGNMSTIWYCVLFNLALWALDRIHVLQYVDILEIQHFFFKDSLEYLLTYSRPVFAQLLVDMFVVTFCSTHLYYIRLVFLLSHAFLSLTSLSLTFSLSVDSYLSACVKLFKATNHFGSLEMQITLSRFRFSWLNDLLSITRLFFALAF